MRTTLLLWFVLLAACDRSKGEAIKIGNRPPMVGDVETTHQDNLFQATISSPRGQAEMIYRQLADQQHEILGLDGAGRVNRVKVTYVSESHTMTLLGDTEQQAPATSGHIYLVSREDGAVRVSREDGRAPTDEELALVLAEHQDLGVPDRVQQAISRRTWRRGERVTLAADELGGARMRATRISSLALTLRRVDAGIAQFEMHIGMATRDADRDHTSTVSGIMKVDVANGRVMEIAGGGPIQGRMAGLPFTGHATILMEVQ